MKHPSIEQLLATKMDRREFLRYAAGVTLGVVGITALVKTVKSSVFLKQPSASPKGYGSRAYGD